MCHCNICVTIIKRLFKDTLHYPDFPFLLLTGHTKKRGIGQLLNLCTMSVATSSAVLREIDEKRARAAGQNAKAARLTVAPGEIGESAAGASVKESQQSLEFEIADKCAFPCNRLLHDRA